MNNTFSYGTDHLTAQPAIALATGTITGQFDDAALLRINNSSARVQQLVESGITTYGVNTGFGILSNTRISAADTVSRAG